MGKIANWLLAVIAVLLSIMAVAFVGPAVETRFFPVYSRFVVVTAEDHEGGTLATFRFTKYRQCDARGWAWFIGEFGAVSRQVEVKPAEGIRQDRPLGASVSSPYVIAAAPDDVRNRMHAEIYSRCHGLWLTRSVVYP